MKNRLLLCLLVLGLAFALPVAAQAAMKIGDPIPAGLAVKGLDGKEVKLADVVKGKPTAIIFFNTVCKNCVAELRQANKLFSKDGKVNVIAIGVDMGGEKVLERFAKQEAYNYSIYADPEFTVGNAFGFSYTPASVYVDGEGKLKDMQTGYGEDGKAKLEAFLK